MTTKISDQIWDDPDFMELSDSEKLAVFWILTKVNLLGYVESTPRKFARDLEAPFESLEGACKGLARSFVKTQRGIWCRNYIRKQFGCGQALARSHMAKSIRKQIADAPEDLRLLIEEEYPEIFSPSHESPKGLGSSSEATREGEGEGEIEREGETAEGGPGETHPALLRARRLFRMRDTTILDAKSQQAWQKNKKAWAALPETDWRHLEWAYAQAEGDAARYRRRDLQILLNNLTAEVTRARGWAAAAGVRPSAPPAEPTGWRDLITSEFPECNLTTYAALPESMKAFVRDRLARPTPAPAA
jgi:hypothetical protein